MIYLITGYKRSGKDTISDYLRVKTGCTKVSLAEALKETLRVLFNWSRAHTDGHLKEEVDPTWWITPRKAMQVFGTEIMQFEWPKHFDVFSNTIGRKFWCFRLWETMKEGNDYVLSDVRFPHEVDFFRGKSDKVVVIRVVRPGVEVTAHASESSIDDILPDYVIYNDSTVEDLYYGIDLILEDMKNKGVV